MSIAKKKKFLIFSRVIQQIHTLLLLYLILINVKGSLPIGTAKLALISDI